MNYPHCNRAIAGPLIRSAALNARLANTGGHPANQLAATAATATAQAASGGPFRRAEADRRSREHFLRQI